MRKYLIFSLVFSAAVFELLGETVTTWTGNAGTLIFSTRIIGITELPEE
jgi:hypothetical protein